MCSLFLINANISSDSYTILPFPHNNITVVQFKGNFGCLMIFNIYNEITNNNTIQFLSDYLDDLSNLIHSNDDHMIWLGDFNHHHLMWEDEMNEHLFEPDK